MYKRHYNLSLEQEPEQKNRKDRPLQCQFLTQSGRYMSFICASLEHDKLFHAGTLWL